MSLTLFCRNPLAFPGRPKGRTESGFTLLEAMISAFILSVVTGAVLSLLYQGQETYETESRLSRDGTQVRLAMDHIVRSIRHAGNDPEGYLREHNISPLEILSSVQFRVNSDITGAVASVTSNTKESTGDPDGTLDSIYERTTYRYIPGPGTLLVNVGYGETILVNGLKRFELEFFDELGEATDQDNEIARVRIWMVGSSRLPTGGVRVIPLSSEVFIRKRAIALGSPN